MKKTLNAFFLALLIVQPVLMARRGDSALGVLGGVAVGTMIGSAAASQSDRSSRAEHEALRAQDKTEQVRVEQERMRMEQQINNNRNFYVLIIILISLIMVGIFGAAFFLLHRKK